MSAKTYATVSDILALGKTLTAAQQEAAEKLLREASARLRIEARKYGKDIDAMIADPETGEDFALAAASVVAQAVCRALDALSQSSAAVAQGTESIGAYSLTATYLNAGRTLYFMKNELKDLGLLRQVIGVYDPFRSEEE